VGWYEFISDVLFHLCCKTPATVPENEEVRVISRKMYFSSVSATLGALFTGRGMCLWGRSGTLSSFSLRVSFSPCSKAWKKHSTDGNWQLKQTTLLEYVEVKMNCYYDVAVLTLYTQESLGDVHPSSSGTCNRCQQQMPYFLYSYRIY